MENDKSEFKKAFIKRLILFAARVIKLAEQLQRHRSLWKVLDQVIASASSMGANVVEAKGAGSKRDYLNFFTIALKSGNESLFWFLVLQEVTEGNDRSEVVSLYRECDELVRILASSVLTMKGKR